MLGSASIPLRPQFRCLVSEFPESARRAIRFGVFELDLHAAELRKAGARISIQEQPFLALALLLERPGELVTREELRSACGPMAPSSIRARAERGHQPAARHAGRFG